MVWKHYPKLDVVSYGKIKVVKVEPMLFAEKKA
jgi:hypothetical protein